MELPITERDIAQAETMLACGDTAAATGLLERLAEQAQDYISTECEPSDQRQYFSFADAFERLSYRRIEGDPRELIQVPVPFDRLFSALSWCYIAQQDYVSAKNALSQAVRWNPMNCAYRLDLSELYRALGDEREAAALAHSVIGRASDAPTAARAYSALGKHFLDRGEPQACLGCICMAQRMMSDEPHTKVLREQLQTAYPDVMNTDPADAVAALAAEGVDTNPSAEIAICLLMCATDAMDAHNQAEAARLVARARGLIGEEACAALVRLIRDADAELAGQEVPDKKGEQDAE